MYGSDVNAACPAGDGCSTAGEHQVAMFGWLGTPAVVKLSDS